MIKFHDLAIGDVFVASGHRGVKVGDHLARMEDAPEGQDSWYFPGSFPVKRA